MSAVAVLDQTDTSSHSALQRVRDFRTKLSLTHILTPPPFEVPDFPSWVKEVVAQVQGFASPKSATDEVNIGLTSEEDGIFCIPLLQMINLGLTRQSTQHTIDFAQAITQKLGKPIYLQGNSLGGFFAHLIAFAHPENVEGMVLTASPHQLTLDPKTLKEHTNIALFLGWMTAHGLKHLCDQTMIQNWTTYRNDPTSEIAQEMEAVFGSIAKAYYAATHDRTVNGKACLASAPNGIETAHNARSFAVYGDHGDVARGAIDSMRHLILHGLHAELPDHIAAGLADVEEITDLVHVPYRHILSEYAVSNAPRFAGEIRQGRIGGAVYSAINAPSSLLSRARSTQAPASIEPAGLSIAGGK